MRGLKTTLAGTAMTALGLVLAANTANATLFTLQDLNSQVDIETQSGVLNWIISPGVEPPTDVMFGESFWYRTGADTRENALGSVPITFEQASNTNANPGNDVLNVTYTQAGVFTAAVRYSLQGGTLCCSDLAEQITITNLSSTTPLQFTLFEYTDFDIGSVDDGVATFTNGNTFTQSDKGFTTQTIVGPAPDRWEIDFYDNTISKLDDGDIDDLSNTTSPLFNGDLTWAAQWNFIIGPGGSVTVSKDKLVSANVPAPASLALFGVGLAGLGFARRRKA